MYDVRVHLPARVELLLSTTENPEGRIETYEQILTDIKTLVSDKTFIQDLEGYKKEYDKAKKELEKKYLEDVKKSANETDIEKAQDVIEGAAENYIAGVAEETESYVNVVNSYILEFMRRMKDGKT